MEDFDDLATLLRKYREDASLSKQQMAEKLAVSEGEYSRLEDGTLIPSPEEEKKYRNALSLEKHGPPPPVKWYRSGMWHWVIPVIISAAFFWIMMDSEGFREGYDKDPHAEPPVKGFLVMGSFFCAVYWYFWTPEWPFKKKKKQ